MAITYDPQKVIVTFKGSRLTGFMDGTFLSAERSGDSFAIAVGTDGEVARASLADKSGEVKLTLMQTSQGNDILSAALAADELTKLGTGTLMVKDSSGRTLLQSKDAWVKKPATVEFGKEIGGREWTLVCGNLEIVNIGGN